MKNFLALLFLFPLFSSAQDTCGLKRNTDPFSHQKKISTGFIPFLVNGSPLSISVEGTNAEIDFFLWFTGGSKCFDDASTIQINYEGDRLKANFKNSGSMNCEGAFHITFRNTPATASNLQRLTDRKVASFRINGPNKSITDVVFSADQKKQLMKMASCVVREAKLIPK